MYGESVGGGHAGGAGGMYGESVGGGNVSGGEAHEGRLIAKAVFNTSATLGVGATVTTEPGAGDISGICLMPVLLLLGIGQLKPRQSPFSAFEKSASSGCLPPHRRTQCARAHVRARASTQLHLSPGSRG